MFLENREKENFDQNYPKKGPFLREVAQITCPFLSKSQHGLS